MNQSNIIICQMSVRPSVLTRMYSVIFLSFVLWKIPKNREFSEVLQSTFRYHNSLIIFRLLAEKLFSGIFRKFKFLHFKHFYACFGDRMFPDSEFLGFSAFGITGWTEFTEYPVYTGKKFNFFLFLLLCSNKGFRGR